MSSRDLPADAVKQLPFFVLPAGLITTSKIINKRKKKKKKKKKLCTRHSISIPFSWSAWSRFPLFFLIAWMETLLSVLFFERRWMLNGSWGGVFTVEC